MYSETQIRELNAGLHSLIRTGQGTIDVLKQYKPDAAGDYIRQVQTLINTTVGGLAFHRADNIPTDPAIVAAFRKFKATIDQYNAKYGKTFTIPPVITHEDPDTGARETYTLESTLTFLATTPTRPTGDSPGMGGAAATADHHGANDTHTHGGAGGFYLDIPAPHLAGAAVGYPDDGHGHTGKGGSGGCSIQ